MGGRNKSLDGMIDRRPLNNPLCTNNISFSSIYKKHFDSELVLSYVFNAQSFVIFCMKKKDWLFIFKRFKTVEIRSFLFCALKRNAYNGHGDVEQLYRIALSPTGRLIPHPDCYYLFYGWPMFLFMHCYLQFGISLFQVRCWALPSTLISGASQKYIFFFFSQRLQSYDYAYCSTTWFKSLTVRDPLFWVWPFEQEMRSLRFGKNVSYSGAT